MEKIKKKIFSCLPSFMLGRMQTRHAAVLTTLKAASTYYFSVKSVDGNGNDVVSDEHSIRTPKPQVTVSEKIVDSLKSIFQQVKP